MSDDLPSQRYRLLVEQLGEERGNKYGWKSEVARLLEVHPSYISRIASGEQATLGRDAIRRACRQLGINERFFDDRTIESPHYRSYMILPGTAEKRQSVAMAAPRLEEQRAQWDALLERAIAFDERTATLADAATLAKSVLDLRIVRYANMVRREIESNEKAGGTANADMAIAAAYGLSRQIIDIIHALHGPETGHDREATLD